MSSKIILTLVFICALTGCQSSVSQNGTNGATTPQPARTQAPPRQQKTDPNAALELTLERTACYGTCPTYTVKITAEGKIIFDGKQYTAVKGEATTDLPKEKKAELIEAIDAADVFSLNDSYTDEDDGCPSVATDSSSAFLSIRLDGKEKKIKHYLGCVEQMDFKVFPASLFTLENKIDEIINTKRWIKPDK